jgi:hypothetical protein
MTPEQVADMVNQMPAPAHWMENDRRVWRSTVIRVAEEIRVRAQGSTDEGEETQ